MRLFLTKSARRAPRAARRMTTVRSRASNRPCGRLIGGPEWDAIHPECAWPGSVGSEMQTTRSCQFLRIPTARHGTPPTPPSRARGRAARPNPGVSPFHLSSLRNWRQWAFSLTVAGSGMAGSAALIVRPARHEPDRSHSARLPDAGVDDPPCHARDCHITALAGGSSHLASVRSLSSDPDVFILSYRRPTEGTALASAAVRRGANPACARGPANRPFAPLPAAGGVGSSGISHALRRKPQSISGAGRKCNPFST